MNANLLFFVWLNLLAFTAFGQALDRAGTIKEAEFIIEKEKKNYLPESNRLFKKAIIPSHVPKNEATISYQLTEILPMLDVLAHKIRLLKAKQELFAKLYVNYIKGGYGNKHMPYLAYYFDNKLHEDYGYGFHTSHFSLGKDSYGEAYHNVARLHGKWAKEHFSLNGDIYYQGDKYPRIKLDNQTKHDPKQAQIFHQVGFHTRLANHMHQTFDYQIPIAFTHLHNKQGEKEYQGSLSSNLTYTLNQNFKVNASSALLVSKYQCKTTYAINRNLASFKPTLYFSLQEFTIQTGCNLVYQNDVSTSIKHFNAYPIVEIGYTAFTWVRPYIGLGGDIQPNFWHQFIGDNPWVMPQVDLRHTNQSFVFYGGLQGTLSEQLNFHAGANLGSYHNLPFFINNASDPRQFTIQYDPETSLCYVFSELTHMNQAETFVNRIKANYYYYAPQQLPIPCHKPSYSLELLSTYKLYDKLLAKSTLACLGGIQALEPIAKTTKPLLAIIDLGVSLDYLWNQRFSIFLDCQNLLNRNHSQYLNTPTQGFSVLAGITYAW